MFKHMNKISKDRYTHNIPSNGKKPIDKIIVYKITKMASVNKFGTNYASGNPDEKSYRNKYMRNAYVYELLADIRAVLCGLEAQQIGNAIVEASVQGGLQADVHVHGQEIVAMDTDYCGVGQKIYNRDYDDSEIGYYWGVCLIFVVFWFAGGFDQLLQLFWGEQR